MYPIRILTGQKFGRLLVLGIHHKRVGNTRAVVAWDCLCECGNAKLGVKGTSITQGLVASCGCYAHDRRTTIHLTHGQTNTPEYQAYIGAKGRCCNPNQHKYPIYGGRGIEFRFESFEEFYAELGDKPTPNHSVNRIDNDGHYEKGNIEWATPTEQSRNKRNSKYYTWRGVTKHISQWAEELGYNRFTLTDRLVRYKWTEEEAFTIPIGTRRSVYYRNKESSNAN